VYLRICASVRRSPGIDPGKEFNITNQAEFSKLEQDLATVFEKIKLCREMLVESPGIQEDDALAEVGAAGCCTGTAST
jgi:hypothetical protein